MIGWSGRSAQFLGRPPLAERVLLFLALVTYAYSTPFDWFASVGAGSTSGAPTQALFLLFLTNTVVALNGNWHVALSAISREPLILVFLGLALLSSMWSNAPTTTFQDVIVLGVTYLTAIHLVVRFTLEETLRMLGVVFAAGLVINMFFILFISSQGLDTVNVATDGGSAWSGVFPSKNGLGRIAVLGILVTGFNIRLRRSFFVWPGILAGHVMLLFGSNSATSLGALGGLIALTVVFLGFRGRKTLYGATALAMLTVFSALTVLAATNLATFTGLLGKDSNFTGRLPMWKDTFRYGVSEQPVRGFGWGRFWVDRDAFDVLLNNSWNITHAHNAFVDALLFLGPLGPLLLGAIFLRGLFWSARNIRATPTAIGLFPALAISMALVFSLTESGFVSRSIQFIILIVALVVAAENKEVRRPFAPPLDKLNNRDAQLVDV